MSPKLIYIISPHTSTPPPPIFISIALPSFTPQILKRSPHLPFPGACGHSEKMKTSAPLQIPRNFSLRAGPGLLRTPGFPSAPPAPSRSRPSCLTRMDYSSPLCVGRLFPCVCYSSRSHSPGTRGFPRQWCFESPQDFLFFSPHFLCVCMCASQCP